ncbi:MAG: hypothetical protein AABY03_01670 [Nanoarchaeota archaeon]
MKNAYQEREHNLVLSSLSSEVSRVFGLASRGNLQLDEEKLSYVQEFRDYFAKACRGERIKKGWEAGKGILISRRTQDKLYAYEEICYRLKGWNGQTISRIGHALKDVKHGRINDIESRFAYDFFLNLARESLRNPVYQGCREVINADD